jgi:hypothetical protein
MKTTLKNPSQPVKSADRVSRKVTPHKSPVQPSLRSKSRPATKNRIVGQVSNPLSKKVPERGRAPRVNQPFDQMRIRWPEMVQYSFSDIHELRIFRWSLEESDITAVQSGALQIRFESSGSMRYLVTAVDTDAEPFRAPIAWWLLPTRECAAPAGADLRVILVDGKSGFIKAVREIRLDSETEASLVECLQRQAQDTFGHLEMDVQLKRDLRAA